MSRCWPWTSLFLLTGEGLVAQTRAEPSALVVHGERWREEEGSFQGDTLRLEKEEWERRGVSSVPDLLEQEGIPFVSLNGDGRTGSPTLRGYSGDRGNRVAVLLDGLPVNRPDLAGADWGQFALSGLSEVKVYRGSRTVRYGSLASAGVIELRRARGRGEGKASFEGFTGEDEIWGGNVSAQVPGKWLALDLGGSVYETEGHREGTGREDEHWRATLYGPESETLESRWTFGGGETFFEFAPPLTFAQFRDDVDRAATGDFAEIDSWQAAQILQWNGEGNWNVSSRTLFRSEEREIEFGGNVIDDDLMRWNGELVFHREGETLKYWLGLRWGAEGLSRVTINPNFSRAPLAQDATVERNNGALFAIGEWQLGSGFQWRQGVSVEIDELSVDSVGRSAANNFSERDRLENWAAEAALEWESEIAKTWLRFERVYRFPLLDEIASISGFPLPVAFNGDLGPEEGYGFEWGIEKSWGELEAGGTIYGTWLEGEIGFDGRLNTNFEATERVGGELWLDWEGEQVKAGMRYGYTQARFREGEFEGNDLPLVPRHSLHGYLEVEPLEGLTVRGTGGYWSASFQADDFENARREIPSRALFHLGVNWAVREDLEVFLKVNNILDRRYASFAAAESFFPAAGRQWTVGVRAEF